MRVARTKRLYFPNTLYHVFNRGNEKKEIFNNNEDRIKFLTILESALKKFNLKIYAYVLMPNHYHILLEDINGDLPKIMKYIGENYAMYFNWRYKRVGHLYQGRYRSIIVEKEKYLKEVVRYIILNPIRAGLVDKLINYNWSCYYEYIGKNKRFKLTETDFVLKQFDEDKSKALVLFKRYLTKNDDAMDKIIEESLINDLIFGTEKFKKGVIGEIKSLRTKIKNKILRSSNSKTVEEIIKKVVEELKINEIELKKKKGKNNYAKKLAIYLIKYKTNYSLEEIGKIFNMHPVSISRQISLIKEEIKQNKYLQKMIASLL